MKDRNPKPSHSTPSTTLLALKLFFRIEGAQRAAAFAYYSFFSLFPLALLTVTVASFFIDRDRAVRGVVDYFRNYAPLDARTDQNVFDTITGVIEARDGASIIASLIVLAGAFSIFDTLIEAVNRAWGVGSKNWWHLPLKNSLMLGITGLLVLLSLTVPVVFQLAGERLISSNGLLTRLFAAGMVIAPMAILFIGLSALYRMSPFRPTRFREVWSASLVTTALLCILESSFVYYLAHFARLNVVYGAFGGMMALLMWIYLSGGLVILGACLSAAGSTRRSGGKEPPRLP